MSDQIHITLSRADAELLSDLADEGLAQQVRWLCSPSLTPEYRAELVQLSNDGRRVIDLVDAALAAPAEPVPDWFRELPVSEWSARASQRKASFPEDMQRPPAEGPERAATGETLDELIAECEAKGWEWLLSGLNMEPNVYEAVVFPAREWRIPKRRDTPASALRSAIDAVMQRAAIGGDGEG